MRKFFTVGLWLTLGSFAFGQATLVSEHPMGTTPNWSAYRYDPQIYIDPKCGDNTAIPLSETRRVLCDLVESPLMSKKVNEWVDLALAGSGQLNKEDVFVTFLETCRENNGPPHFGHVHGNEMQVASGVVRPFYATALYYTLQCNKIAMTKRLNNDVLLMLRDGDNDATNRIVDYITGTVSGPELDYPDFCRFVKKRDVANWYFTNVGFVNFNLNQKIHVTPPTGRDLQLLGRKLPMNYENSNRVTTNQAAALMYLLDSELIVSPCVSRIIKSYMYRPVEQIKVSALQGIAAGLPVGSKMVSMNAYTNRNYHDVAVVTLPNHKQYVLAVFTKYNKYPTNFIPLLSRIVAHRLMQKTGDDEPSDYLYARPLAGE